MKIIFYIDATKKISLGMQCAQMFGLIQFHPQENISSESRFQELTNFAVLLIS